MSARSRTIVETATNTKVAPRCWTKNDNTMEGTIRKRNTSTSSACSRLVAGTHRGSSPAKPFIPKSMAVSPA